MSISYNTQNNMFYKHFLLINVTVQVGFVYISEFSTWSFKDPRSTFHLPHSSHRATLKSKRDWILVSILTPHCLRSVKIFLVLHTHSYSFGILGIYKLFEESWPAEDALPRSTVIQKCLEVKLCPGLLTANNWLL